MGLHYFKLTIDMNGAFPGSIVVGRVEGPFHHPPTDDAIGDMIDQTGLNAVSDVHCDCSNKPVLDLPALSPPPFTSLLTYSCTPCCAKPTCLLCSLN